MEWFLLFVVAVSVAVWAALSIKRLKSEERSASPLSGSDTGEDSHTANSGIEPSAVEKGLAQITIYEYRPSAAKCCCVCNGENEVTAKHCQICGQKLN